ncbi:hypothetical protein [Marinobacterium sp. BA1]|uniref:hypothetical protein n=1 Tax=Marinobacterium sp. BA1 TaxID=3138931 RepID=UPI0032E712F5
MIVLSDEYINSLFIGTNFGDLVNGSVAEKRKLIIKNLKNQLDGYWSGHTIYNILVHGGFLHDAKTSEQKRLTALGIVFLREAEEVQS